MMEQIECLRKKRSELASELQSGRRGKRECKGTCTKDKQNAKSLRRHYIACDRGHEADESREEHKDASSRGRAWSEQLEGKKSV